MCLSKLGDATVEQRVSKQVAELAARFPIYEARMNRRVAKHEEVTA